jgi:isopentenyl-diphosphate delta-isomerase
MTDQVVLVDPNDVQIGTMEKYEAHRKGLLHRAISVFLFNSNGQWLLQQRADDKYHSQSLWSNTCCTHPYPGEANLDAAHRRLEEEMGLRCELTDVFHFLYKEPLDNELTEHELDHVFMGVCDDLPVLNPMEVMAYRFIDFKDLVAEIEQDPEQFTVWFRKIVEPVHADFLKKGIKCG